jgi:putative hemolysin
MNFSIPLWLAIIGLLGSLFFSILSYALRTASRVKLEESLNRFHRPGALDAILSARFDLALTASVLRLVANTTVIFSVAWHFLLQYDNAPHPLKIFGFTLLITVPTLIIVSVAIPQACAKYAGEKLLAFAWPLLKVIHFTLWPLMRVMNVFDEIVRRLAGVSIHDDVEDGVSAVEQEILSVIAEGTAEGAVDEEQKKMIEGVIGFRDLQVGQIMIPRTEIVALDIHTPISEVLDKIVKEGLSRLPLYENSLDNIVGILYAKDLLIYLDVRAPGSGGAAQNEPINIRRIMRPPLFIPRTKPLRDLLREMRAQQVHLAVVLDEYGGTSGLVTTEDIVEEIVGDIADEYERPAAQDLKRVNERVVEVDARMNITEVNRALGLELPEHEDFQTIGGFVIATIGAIPGKGERLMHDGLAITVLDAEPRRVKKLRLELPEAQVEKRSEESLAPG